MADTASKDKPANRKRPRRLLLKQPMMNRVLYALSPLCVAAVYFFGWRAAAILAVSIVTGLAAEAAFTLRRGEPISSAVLVTAVIYALILPPTTPLVVVVVGCAFAVIFGKMIFGGWARNVFNPAMTGRCFVYVCFPNALTGRVWLTPEAGIGGLTRWLIPHAVTQATPLYRYHVAGEGLPAWSAMLIGFKGGSLGETSAVLIALCGVYLVMTRTARWRGLVSCLAAGAVLSGLLHVTGLGRAPHPLGAVLIGGYLFGTVFMVTDPISAARTRWGLVFYGSGVGILTVLVRSFSIWVGGFMFALLLMNAFNPIIDVAVNAVSQRRKARKAKAPT